MAPSHSHRFLPSSREGVAPSSWQPLFSPQGWQGQHLAAGPVGWPVQAAAKLTLHLLQRLLLQDLHDSHICNSLLVAESEEDIWKSETPYTSYRQRVLPTDGTATPQPQVPVFSSSGPMLPLCDTPSPSADYSAEESYQPRDYLAATMQFVPGHFACDVVWSTIIHVHSRLKMGPNMGVSRGACVCKGGRGSFAWALLPGQVPSGFRRLRPALQGQLGVTDIPLSPAIQALRSVLNAFSVVNRKNMFVYQERSTKAVFYLR